MGSKMLVDASHPEEIRVVVAKGSRIEEFDFESASRKPLKGNIYLAKVTRVEPSLQAAFVEYGGNRHGFLAFAEIHPDYYQIPIADRLALIAEQEAEDAEHNDDDDDDDHQERSSRQRNDRSRRNRSAPAKGAETLEGNNASSEASDGGDAEGGDHHDDEATGGDVEHDHHENEPDDHDHDDHDDDDSDNDKQAQPLTASAVDRVSSDVVDHDDDYNNHDHDGESADVGNGDVVSVDEDVEHLKVESIGAEDALEEVPERRQRRQPRRRYKIQEVIKRRQILLVQVVKEERGNKGAALTTYLSLAGRYCVLMPNTARGGGISRKITDAGDRRRLKEVARDVEVPQGMGLIVRTAGAQRTRPEIKRDFDYLIRLWESVRDLTLQSQAPCLVYEEGSLIKRSIRDLYTKDVDEVVVEGEEAYREAKDFMKMLMPSHAKNVKLYKDNRPLFSRYQVETHLDGLLSPTVTLPSGGYLVINQTEALVSIDINSGKATREHNIEDTAVKTNLEASDEIARQLRLRDLAGLIVIDFIDMEENRNNRSVERRIKEALKNDRARIQVGRISHFGLLEMSRQRLRPGITEGAFRTCPHCEGRGIVRSISSCGLGVLRTIEEHLLKKPENLTVRCARDVAGYLLNEKRDSLLELEQAQGITIFIVTGGDDMKGTQATIERAHDRETVQRRIPVSAPVRMDSAFEDETEEEVEADAQDSEEITEESADTEEGVARENTPSSNGNGERDGGRRRRRRGRRGGRRDERGEDGERNAVRTEGSDENHTSEDADTERSDAPQQFEQQGDEAGDERPGHEAGDLDGASENAKPESGDRPRRERGGRRGRFGRDRGPRSERTPGAEGGGEPRRERPPREDRPRREDRPPREEAHRETEFTAPPPSPVIVIPEVIADPEPRKWAPPVANVQPEVVERKSGWWSKRK